ncbi:GAF domain-containing protein [Arthrobacter sp. B2I5]|uniref:ANTAR domain-containing protein n=1 Tax=Arthrobacter sp. B2I5 TaxID=3042266 RepID=UPI00278829A6|nr:GAF and ANTAR domain-containing protein [Arthrobacter sp. B2I5]MDQ0824058.1 GAF domain-containing protein [Arthrobacter sp. B2I5]
MVDGKLSSTRSDPLIDVLLDSPDMKVFLERLVELASAELGQGPGGASCSVTVTRNRRPMTVCSSGPEAAEMDEVQYASKQGPCLEAIRSGHQIEVVDLHAETRWPTYVAAMAESPMRSVFAVPIVLKTSGGAALNCYRRDPGPVSEDVRDALLDLAAAAAQSIALSVRLETSAEKSEDLTAAMESRTAINLAAGVLMAQTGCGHEQAMEVLIKASSNRNEKLRDVAHSILARFDSTAPTTHFDSL